MENLTCETTFLLFIVLVLILIVAGLALYLIMRPSNMLFSRLEEVQNDVILTMDAVDCVADLQYLFISSLCSDTLCLSANCSDPNCNELCQSILPKCGGSFPSTSLCGVE